MPDSKNQKPTYADEFASEIIQAIEQGAAPWQKEWKPGELSLQANPVSETTFTGANQIRLAMRGYNDSRWMTYRQAQEQGYQVKRGEKSTRINFYSPYRLVNKLDENKQPVLGPDGNPEKERVNKPYCKYYSVFNGSQIEGIEPLPERAPDWNPIERAEKILLNSGAKIVHTQRDRAMYTPSTDTISLPVKSQFPTAEAYYATVIHELAHWTARNGRVDRETGPKGTPDYAKEELRAEIASWMVNTSLGLGHDPSNHKAYLADWAKALKNDPKEIFRAANQATKIKEFIMGLENEKHIEKTPQEIKAQGKLEAGQEIMRLANVMEALNEGENTGLGKNLAHAHEQLRTLKEQYKLKYKEEWSYEKTEQELQGRLEIEVEKEHKAKEAKPASEKTYLAVPFREKEKARLLGAQWDRQTKTWFAPVGVDLSNGLDKWLPGKSRPAAALSPQEEFAQALKEAGLDLQGKPPEMDGNWHRAPLLDANQGKKDGAYKGFLNQAIPAGIITNHKAGYKANWKYTGHELSAEEKAAIKAQAAKRKQEYAKKQAAAYKAASKRAFGIFENARPASQDHPYLINKQVPNHALKIDQYGNLLVPAYDTSGHLQTFQRINPEGEKKFLKGGKKVGSFYAIGKIKNNSPLFLAEGYSTAASIHQATRLPCIVCFNASNLKPVAEALHKKYPDLEIIICADNDHGLEKTLGNVGIKKAIEAAKAVNGKVIIPEFTQEQKAKGLTDFNDLANAAGKQAVKKQLQAGLGHEKDQGMEL